MMAQDDDSLLKSLIDLVEAVPKFVRPQIERLVSSCMKVGVTRTCYGGNDMSWAPDRLLQVIGNAEAMDTWRQMSLELVVGLAESAPAMVRKFCTKFLPELGTCILHSFVTS